MANLRNGVVAGEWALASTLRWLDGESYFEMIDGPTIACSTAYSVLHRTPGVINSCPDLVIVWLDDDRLGHVAAGFRARSRQGIMDRCVGAVDGFFIRIHKPRVKEHPAPAWFYSGHKKGFGLNLQEIFDAHYIFTAGCISCPGSTNDRTAWNMSNIKSKVEMLPDGYYIIGDSAYPPSDRLLTPYPGTYLCPGEDAFNFFHSQPRIKVEQAFGILVMTWGILWKPLRLSIRDTRIIVHACMRLHNFNRKRRMQVETDFSS
ncbi:unnamed protein product, partial [Discosporangium mesarthrocarpum]